MPTAARVVVMPGEPGPLRVEEIALPDPGPRHVVVKQFASGICHSQLHQMHAPRTAPGVLGHESTGVVLATGREVSHVQEGDKVLLTWIPRDAANADRAPEPVTLELLGGGEVATRNVFTWADHTIADEQYVVKVPESTRNDVTAIIGCAVMTGSGAVYHTAGVQRGESVAIFGVGGVGLCAVVAARVVGADPIIAVDLDERKLEFARSFGASHGVNASKVDPVEAILELTVRKDGHTIGRQPIRGADYAFDCIGVKTTMEQILPAARGGNFGVAAGGTAVLVGIPTTGLELEPRELLMHEKKLIGSIGGSCHPDRDFPLFLRWQQDGLLDLDALVTERYPIEQINEATAALEAGQIRGRAILEF
ncbi:MAG: zinc-binding dehydrogenase [Myxococcota bacterium]